MLSTTWTRVIDLRQFCIEICSFLNGRLVVCADLHVHRELSSMLMMLLLTNHTSNTEETELLPPCVWLCCSKHSRRFNVDVEEFSGLEGFLRNHLAQWFSAMAVH